jgi:hypothetical protein
MKKLAIYFGLLASVAYLGCKKFDNPPPVFEQMKDNTSLQRKVLVISIDGVTGSELASIAPPVLTELKKTSKYTNDVLKGSVANDAASWTSMMTGVSYSKHQIKDDDFLPRPDNDDLHANITSFRNLFDYVLQYKSVQTAVVSPWANLRNYLRVVDFNPVVDTDLAAKDSTISILAKQASLGAIVVNFRDVMAAGNNGGFVASNDNYKNAILKADEYVGNILTALKARKNYKGEDWLVVVTSDHGGSNLDSKPGFMMVSNPNLKEQEVKKSGFNTVWFNPSSVNASVPKDNGLYDSGSNKDFTVQMDVKFNGQTSWPGFLSKSTDLSGQTLTGWFWMQSGANWAVVFGGSANGGTGKNQIAAASNVANGDWKTLTMVVKSESPTSRKVYCYVNGVQTGSGDISGNKSLTTAEALRLGYRSVDGGGTGLNFHGANLAYFNTALAANVIRDNYAIKDITQHPNYANLIGFWPVNEGAESVLVNKAPGGYDMLLRGAFTWKGLGTDAPASVAIDPNASSKSVIVTPASITALTLYWLNIKILPEFGIDGTPFINQYEIEFLK